MATEGELLAGDRTRVVWHQCGSGLGPDPAVRLDPDTSLAGIPDWLGRLLDTSYSFLRDRAKPKPSTLYPSNAQATILEPIEHPKPALSLQLTCTETDALDLLSIWPLCTLAQSSGLLGGLTLRHAAFFTVRTKDSVSRLRS